MASDQRPPQTRWGQCFLTQAELLQVGNHRRRCQGSKPLFVGRLTGVAAHHWGCTSLDCKGSKRGAVPKPGRSTRTCGRCKMESPSLAWHWVPSHKSEKDFVKACGQTCEAYSQRPGSRTLPAVANRITAQDGPSCMQRGMQSLGCGIGLHSPGSWPRFTSKMPFCLRPAFCYRLGVRSHLEWVASR